MNTILESPTVGIARWLARILDILLVALVLVFIIGEGPPNPLTMTIPEHLLMAGLTTMFVGLIVAWKWQKIGAGLLIGGGAFFWLVNFLVSGRLGIGWVLPLFPVTGVLFLIGGWQS